MNDADKIAAAIIVAAVIQRESDNNMLPVVGGTWEKIAEAHFECANAMAEERQQRGLG